MPAKMQKAQSSHIWEKGYDPDQQILAIRYHPTYSHPAGRLVEYLGVDPQTADRVLSAPSTGAALHDFVKGVFEFRG